MGVVTGTDTSTPPAGPDPLLAGVRRLALLADEAADSEAILRALARELLSVPGAGERPVHHLAGPGAGEDPDAPDELVTVYVFEGEGRLSYLLPRGERSRGVSLVVSTGRSFLATEEGERAASVPRIAATGPTSSALLLGLTERGDVEAVVILV